MLRRSETIAFRAHLDLLRQIDEERERFGISRGDWVRGIVTAFSFDRSEEPLGPQVERAVEATQRLEDAIAKLSTNQAKVLFILLTVIGEMAPNDAKEIVRSKLLS